MQPTLTECLADLIAVDAKLTQRGYLPAAYRLVLEKMIRSLQKRVARGEA